MKISLWGLRVGPLTVAYGFISFIYLTEESYLSGLKSATNKPIGRWIPAWTIRLLHFSLSMISARLLFNWSEFIARKILKLWIFWWIHYENNLDLSGSIITFTFIWKFFGTQPHHAHNKNTFFLFIFFICWLKEHRLYINNTNWLRLGVAQTGQWVLTNVLPNESVWGPLRGLESSLEFRDRNRTV